MIICRFIVVTYLNLAAYLRLMRFHKPVGILLLWFPTAWALWLANKGHPPFNLVIYFLLGTICMRAAGCVVNDIADRRIDKHVQRTKGRPLTSGEVSLVEALGVFIVLLLVSFCILVQLPSACFYEACIAVGITILYPFCKRFLSAPQCVLGLAFSMGIPMAYTASGVAFDATMVWLFLINFAWIVAYDTLYAMVDREDDLRLGVKSTAILFAPYDRQIVFLLQCIFHGSWLVLGLKGHYSWLFYLSWVGGLFILVYQQYLLRRKKPDSYFSAFMSNVWYGGVMWLGIMLN